MAMILEKLPGLTKGLPGGELLLTTSDYFIDLVKKVLTVGWGPERMRLASISIETSSNSIIF